MPESLTTAYRSLAVMTCPHDMHAGACYSHEQHVQFDRSDLPKRASAAEILLRQPDLVSCRLPAGANNVVRASECRSREADVISSSMMILIQYVCGGRGSLPCRCSSSCTASARLMEGERVSIGRKGPFETSPSFTPARHLSAFLPVLLSEAD